MKKQPSVTAATRQGFIDAFWELCKEKSIEKITIHEITKISGNNRTTFYHYFTDIYDLVEQIEAELIETVNQKISEQFTAFHFDEHSIPTLETLFQIIAPVFQAHQKQLFILLGYHGDPKFITVLRNRLKENLLKFSILPKDTKNLDYILTYIYSSMIGLLSYWYETGQDLPEMEFLELAYSLTAYGIDGNK